MYPIGVKFIIYNMCVFIYVMCIHTHIYIHTNVYIYVCACAHACARMHGTGVCVILK